MLLHAGAFATWRISNTASRLASGKASFLHSTVAWVALQPGTRRSAYAGSV